jgi:predicted TIM-barrel fold metal-dependent hydrolase
MKIDIYCHIVPMKYKQALYQKVASPRVKETIEANPTLFDLDARFRILDTYGCVQVLTLGLPPVETIGGLKEAAELARIANDEVAELVAKYPDRFVAGVASLPMNDLDAALQEADRAIRDLALKGVQIFSSINGKPLDSPEFSPLYEKMVSYNLPIWLHPGRGARTPDYPSEKMSKYQIWSIFGWPYETSAAMTRLIFSGTLERYPSLKIITHHCGAMVPYFAERISCSYDFTEERLKEPVKQNLTKAPVEYYRMFYNDTAVSGSRSALMCAYDFFGPDHILFGTDMPFDNELGSRLVRQTIESVERMDVPDSVKRKLFEENARKLLGLSKNDER